MSASLTTRRHGRVNAAAVLLGCAVLLTGCGSDSGGTTTGAGPACGIVSPKLVSEAVPDLPDEDSDGVGLVRDGDSVTVDPDDARGAQCTQASATDPGNSLDIRITVPSRAALDRLKDQASDADRELKKTCQPLDIGGALGSTCLVDGPSKQVVRAYSIWDARIITIDLARSEGPSPDDRQLVAKIAKSVDDRVG